MGRGREKYPVTYMVYDLVSKLEQLSEHTGRLEKKHCDSIKSAEEIMVDAIHLLRFRSDDSEMSGRMQEWLENNRAA